MSKESAKKLSTESYKGVRDFYPEDMFIENYIFNTWRKIAESFGYEEYNASILEPTELYRGKTSDEIVNEQTYTFRDRGDREVTLRPEMTPTVARMVAGKMRDLAFPLRWYSIPNVFRYEQPQRGRLREHWQLNADIFGSSSVDADIEIITLAYHIMKAFGAKDEDFVIKINNRKIFDDLAKKHGLTPEKKTALLRIVDKKDKMPAKEFQQKLDDLIEWSFDLNIPESSDITEIRLRLAELGIKNTIFDIGIARGFDYYTGTVFEVFDTEPKNKRSLFGGGRYDNLTENFGGDRVPAVGFGVGDVTIRDFLETHDLLPEYSSPAHLYIGKAGEVGNKKIQELAWKLRESGIHVAVDISDKKVGDQVKLAVKQRVLFVIIVGEEELARGTYKIKKLKDSTETELEENKLAEYILKNL